MNLLVVILADCRNRLAGTKPKGISKKEWKNNFFGENIYRGSSSNDWEESFYDKNNRMDLYF
jgi:hypothetical protein